MLFYDSVLNEKRVLVYNGPEAAVKNWLETNHYSFEYSVYVESTRRVMTVEEYLREE